MTRTKDILSLIGAEHQNIEKLVEELETNNESAEIQEIFNQIYKELMLHIFL